MLASKQFAGGKRERRLIWRKQIDCGKLGRDDYAMPAEVYAAFSGVGRVAQQCKVFVEVSGWRLLSATEEIKLVFFVKWCGRC